MIAKGFTHSMSLLHTWGGLIAGWLLFGILLSGSIAVFHAEMTTWLTPEISSTPNADRDRSLALGERFLQTEASHARLWRIDLPSAREPVIKVTWRDGTSPSRSERLDQASGQPIARKTEGGDFFLKYHEGLHIDRDKNQTGLFIVGLAGLAMLVGCIGGIIIHKRMFKDFFLFRPQASPQRSWLDAHNVLGVLPLPFHIMMAFTGLVLLYWLFIPAGVGVLYGGNATAFRKEAITQQFYTLNGPAGGPATTLPLSHFLHAAEQRLGTGTVAYLWVRDSGRSTQTVEAFRNRTDIVSQQVPQVAFNGVTGEVLRVVDERTPAQRVQSFVAALHWLEWGGPAVRLVYFLAGVSGALMAAFGVVIFTLKRERRPEARAPWMRVVHILNVTSVAGFTLACAAFLWAERLTPVDVQNRASIPVYAFFAAWAVTLVHAGLRRSPKSAWIEQLGVAGALCWFAPFLQQRAFIDFAAGDAVRIGIDVALLLIGAALALSSLMLSLPLYRIRVSKAKVSRL